MSWVVDTCILLDVLEDDPEFGAPSAELLDQLAEEGLSICPVTYVELAPAFGGDISLQEEFLSGVGVDHSVAWAFEDTLEANSAWNRLIQERRAGRAAKRPIADVLIGAFAARRTGLVTRNPQDFEQAFPKLEIRNPS